MRGSVEKQPSTRPELQRSLSYKRGIAPKGDQGATHIFSMNAAAAFSENSTSSRLPHRHSVVAPSPIPFIPGIFTYPRRVSGLDSGIYSNAIG